MSIALTQLDQEIESFATHRGIDLTEDMRTLLRDAMLFAREECMTEVIAYAMGDDDSDQAEEIVWREMNDFVDIQRAWIDRCRLEADLPERSGRQFEQSLKNALSRRK